MLTVSWVYDTCFLCVVSVIGLLVWSRLMPTQSQYTDTGPTSKDQRQGEFTFPHMVRARLNDENTQVKRSAAAAAAATVKDYSEGADPPAKPVTKPGTKPLTRPVNRPVTNSSHSTILRGSKHQGQMRSPYSGNQCTSVALYSLLSHMIMRVDTWIADSIDSILVLGTEVHEYFREVARLSTKPDKRVALDDFPDDFPINEHYRGRSRALGFGLVRCMDGDTDLQVFPDLKRFLEDCFAQDLTSVVVTVGDFSISVMEHAGCFWLFDSHACDSAGGKSLLSFQEGKACLLSFANLSALITHIEIHFGNVQYVARAFSFCEADSLCEDETPSHQGSAVEEKMDVSPADMPKDDVPAVEEKVEMAELSKDEMCGIFVVYLDEKSLWTYDQQLRSYVDEKDKKERRTPTSN